MGMARERQRREARRNARTLQQRVRERIAVNQVDTLEGNDPFAPSMTDAALASDRPLVLDLAPDEETFFAPRDEVAHVDAGATSRAMSTTSITHDVEQEGANGSYAARRSLASEQRRKRASRWVAAGAVALGILSVAAWTFRGRTSEMPPPAAGMSPATQAEPVSASSVTSPAVVPIGAAPPAAMDVPSPDEVDQVDGLALPNDTATVAAPKPAPVPAEAREAKRLAQRTLERGQAKQAIEHAQRATEADPEDGEAWLLLGAAHQELGHLREAREAYAACLKQGKRGPRHECAAMLR
jgi:tetratricopeptide (TPR) repeat protein